jgi:hypothetical protein
VLNVIEAIALETLIVDILDILKYSKDNKGKSNPRHYGDYHIKDAVSSTTQTDNIPVTSSMTESTHTVSYFAINQSMMHLE